MSSKNLVILILINICFFSKAIESEKVIIKGSLAVNNSYVTVRGEVLGEPQGVTQAHRDRIMWEGLTFNLWTGAVPFCKWGTYQVPLISILKGTIDEKANRFGPLVTIINASDLKCAEIGMPEWDKDFLINCGQLSVEINSLKQHDFPVIENQRSEIHIRIDKLRRVYKIKKCNEKHRAIYGF